MFKYKIYSVAELMALPRKSEIIWLIEAATVCIKAGARDSASWRIQRATMLLENRNARLKAADALRTQDLFGG